LRNLKSLRRSGVVVAILAVAGVPATAHAASTVVVGTPQGAVRGIRAAGADRFLGLPYAKPPIKSRRFKPPVAAATWSGTRDATLQGPACTQFEPTGVREQQATSEDCLYLDLYRPSTARRGSNLPVIVWLHGGGYTQGTGVIYGGQTLAALTNTIVVSINYRLGAFGYLALPQLDAETPQGSGSWGLMDQLQSLKWVRRQVAAYGGDPKLVTIAGQSAGAGSVCGLLAAPSAKGYFQRAIIESGSSSCRSTAAAAAASRATTEQTGLTFAHAAGCTNDAVLLDCLRRAWVGDLVSAMKRARISGWTIGGSLLPENPRDAIAAGRWNKVPILMGTNRNEYRLLNVAAYKTTPDEYTATVQRTYGAAAGDVLAQYPLAGYPAPFYALTSLQTDAIYACGAHVIADKLSALTPTYEYEFNDPDSPTLYGFQPPGIDMNSAHSAELAYIFDFTLGNRPLTATQVKLATQMKRYWAAFARTGDPNAKGEPHWPRHTAANAQVLTLRPTGSAPSTGFVAEHRCDFWATHGTVY
jgi:para-nitrobenzyl esterase